MTHFHIAEPKRPGGGIAKKYYKHIEFCLLQKFGEKFGGHKKLYPLLNKNAGSDKNITPGKRWDRPLSGAGKKPSWALKPTDHWEFTQLEDL